MSHRIAETFKQLAGERRRALVGYLTAGDPNPAAGTAIAIAACRAGLDILEIGVPFSDPTSDGPAIQLASQRALKAGASVAATLASVNAIRAACDTPIILFTYYNPLLRYGLERLCREAASAGVNGLLIVDLPPEEAGELQPHAAVNGLDIIRLVTPTTASGRMAAIAEGASGFLYLITRTGVTGGGSLDVAAIGRHAAELRQVTTLPVCLGFGISTTADVAALGPLADGLVVGSALVRLVAEHGTGAASPVAAAVRGFRLALDAVSPSVEAAQ